MTAPATTTAAEWVERAVAATRPADDAAAQAARDRLRRFTDLIRKAGAAITPNPVQTVKHWVAQVDGKLSAQVNAVMHHPAFRKLEGTWRGLRLLVGRADPAANLKVKVLDVGRRELVRDFQRAADFDQSALFKKVYEEEYGQLGGQPYGLLVADYEFTADADDLFLLSSVSKVAAAAHAPLVAAAAPGMFRLDGFDDLPAARNLAALFAGPDYAAWRSYRDGEDARYVALTLPRILARAPYGAGATRVRAFNFEEEVEGRTRDGYVWMSAAWAYAAVAADAYAREGWFMRTRGTDGGGRVDGLPAPPFPTGEGAAAARSPLETAISDRREFELARLGFLPLLPGKHGPFAVFPGSQSTQRPKAYQDEAATVNAELSSKFNYMLSVSRFAHYVKVLARDRVGAGMEIVELQRWLNDWLLKYVIGNPESVSDEVKARKPLSAADVQVVEMKGRPGWYTAVAHLRPHYQMESLTTSMRLVAEVPRLG